MTAQHLKRRYGEAVTVEYVDLANETEREKHADIVELIEANGMVLPVTAIDGVPRLSGYVDFWAIGDLIDAKINSGTVQSSQVSSE